MKHEAWRILSWTPELCKFRLLGVHQLNTVGIGDAFMEVCFKFSQFWKIQIEHVLLSIPILKGASKCPSIDRDLCHLVHRRFCAASKGTLQVPYNWSFSTVFHALLGQWIRDSLSELRCSRRVTSVEPELKLHQWSQGISEDRMFKELPMTGLCVQFLDSEGQR